MDLGTEIVTDHPMYFGHTLQSNASLSKHSLDNKVKKRISESLLNYAEVFFCMCSSLGHTMTLSLSHKADLDFGAVTPNQTLN